MNSLKQEFKDVSGDDLWVYVRTQLQDSPWAWFTERFYWHLRDERMRRGIYSALRRKIREKAHDKL